MAERTDVLFPKTNYTPDLVRLKNVCVTAIPPSEAACAQCRVPASFSVSA